MTEPAIETNEEKSIDIPESVKVASDKAMEMMTELNKPVEKTDLKPEDQDSKLDQGEDTPEKDVETAPPEGDKALKKDDKVPEKKKKDDDDTWKQKYSVLQGKYNAEIPRMNAQIHSQAQEIARLNDEINTLKASGNVKSGDGMDDVNDTDNFSDDIDPESFAEYGDEFVKMAKKNKSLSEEIATLKKSFGSDQEDRNRQRGEQFYAKMVDYDDVNNNPAFIAWLKTDVHPSFGVPRYSKFAEAVNQFDATRVIAIFEEFKALSPDETPTPKPNQPKKPVIKNVQPTKTKAENVSMVNADGARIWTPATMKKHFDDQVKGLWKGRENEWETLKNDLFSAQTQGRVRPD